MSFKITSSQPTFYNDLATGKAETQNRTIANDSFDNKPEVYAGGRLEVDVYAEDAQQDFVWRGLYKHAEAAGLSREEARKFADNWATDRLLHQENGATRPYTAKEFDRLKQKGTANFDLNETYSANVLSDLRERQTAFRIAQQTNQPPIQVDTIGAPEYSEAEQAVKLVTDTITSITGTETEVGKQLNRLSISGLRLMGQLQNLQNKATGAATEAIRAVAPEAVDRQLDKYDEMQQRQAQALKNADSTVTNNDRMEDVWAARNGIKRPLAEDLHRKLMYAPDPANISNAIDSAIKGDFKEDDGTYSDQVGKFIGGLNPAADVRDIVANGKKLIEGKPGAAIPLIASVIGAIPGGGDIAKPIIKKLGKEVLEKSAKEIETKVAEKLIKEGVEKEAAEKIAKEEVEKAVKEAEAVLVNQRQDFKQVFTNQRYDDYAREVKAVKAKKMELQNIPTEDLVAIKGYTSDDYKMLNTALRNNDKAELKRLEPYIEVAKSGLRQLPSFKGTVFRGTTLSPEQLAKYEPGKIVTEDAFTSTSIDKSAAFSGNTEFYIDSVKGKDISILSDYPNEKEILFKPYTKFEVLKVITDENTGNKIIIMNEID